jgi:hypothetical protein
VRKAYGESSVDCIGPGTTAEFVGGEYAGGAESLRCLGRRVGVVVANGFVILLLDTGAAGEIPDERDLANDGIDDLDSFLDTNLFKLKGILSFEEVLICEQNVGAGEIAIFCLSGKEGADG